MTIFFLGVIRPIRLGLVWLGVHRRRRGAHSQFPTEERPKKSTKMGKMERKFRGGGAEPTRIPTATATTSPTEKKRHRILEEEKKEKKRKMGFKINMKRKEFEDVNDEDGFSSTFPPCWRKYRRLNGAGEWIFSPYAEDDGPSADTSMVASTGPLSTVMDDVMSCLSVNIPDEKAIVLYNPQPGSSSSAAAAAAAAASLSASNPLLLGVKSHSSADFPIVLDSGLIPGLKECISWPGNSLTMKHLVDEMATSTSMEAADTCLAVVPWVESQSSVTNVAGRPPMVDVSEPMEAEGEAEMMDIEDGTSRAKEAFEFSGMGEGAEGFQHWQLQQQQHYVRPPFLENTSSPVSW